LDTVLVTSAKEVMFSSALVCLLATRPVFTKFDGKWNTGYGRNQ